MGGIPEGRKTFFRITPDANDLCVFAVKRGDIENRIDADYYSPKFANFRKQIESSLCDIVTIADISKKIVTGFAAGKQNQADNLPDEKRVPHLRPFNITAEGDLSFEAQKYVPKDGLRETAYCKKNEVIFNNTNSSDLVGKTTVFDADILCATSNHMTRIVLKDDVNPYYISRFFNMLRSIGYWKLLCTNFNNQAGINIDTLKGIRIPLPKQSIQDKMVAEITSAKAKTNAAHQKADELRESIIEDMQNALNVVLPKSKPKLYSAITLGTLKNNITRRLDTKCYDGKFQDIRNAIDTSAYPKYKLSDLVLEITGGDWGYDSETTKDSLEKCLVLRATEISNKDNIQLRDDKIQYRQIEKKKLAAMNVEIGDIIVEKSGGSVDQPVGRVICVDQLTYNGCRVAYSNFLTKLKINKELVDPYYLFEYLRFVHKIGLTEVMQNQTNGIRNLIVDEYLEQTVIVPPNHRNIGSRMKEKRLLAQEYENQAEAEWQAAKEQFEKELLGE